MLVGELWGFGLTLVPGSAATTIAWNQLPVAVDA